MFLFRLVKVEVPLYIYRCFICKIQLSQTVSMLFLIAFLQGNEVLKNFNIMEEAGGVGIGIYRDFDNVSVNGAALEIHLYWSGKGTTAIPDRGVYGPLISAITVTPSKF